MAARTSGAMIAGAVGMMIMVTTAVLAPVADGAGGGGSSSSPVSCGNAVSALTPCGAFLLGAGAAVPTDACCRGAVSLQRMARTVEARRALCRCLERAGPSFGVLPERARLLPRRCNLALSIPIGADTDCNKIS